MHFNPLWLLVCIILLAVLALGITSTATRQIDVEVAPNPLAPTFRCHVVLFFYNRRTICPGLPVQNYRTPRNEGFFECVSAYDKYQTAFAFSIIGCVFAFFGMLIAGAAAFLPPSSTTRRVRAWIIVALAAMTFVSFTISWPLVRSEISQKQCGRKLKGFVMSTFTTVIDPTFAYGHTLGIIAWGISFGALLLAIVAACLTHNAKDDHHSNKHVPVANDPASNEMGARY